MKCDRILTEVNKHLPKAQTVAEYQHLAQLLRDLLPQFNKPYKQQIPAQSQALFVQTLDRFQDEMFRRRVSDLRIAACLATCNAAVNLSMRREKQI